MAFDIITQQLLNGIVLGSIYGLIAIGYTMVYGIIGMINFAHGDIYMVSAYVTAIALAICLTLGISSITAALIVTLIVTLIIMGVYGWLIERIAYRPLRKSSRLSALISAIGMSLVLQNYVQVSQGAENKGIPNIVSGVIQFGQEQPFVQISTIQLIIIITAALVMLLLSLIIKFTRIGLAMRATQQDLTMSNILGIHTNKVISIVFIVGACIAGIAGMLVSLNYGSFDFYIGFVIGIKAFTAAVLGGIGSLPGAMLGGLALGMAESLFSGFINTDYKDVFSFSLLILVLMIRPHGFLGKPAVEKI